MEPSECLAALWTRARSDADHPVIVSYVARRTPWEIGLYNPNSRSPQFFGGRILYVAQIDIFRDEVPQPENEPDLVTQPLEDLITVAHEYGHHSSYVAGEQSEELWIASHVLCESRDRCLTEREGNLVLGEESRAWSNGRRVLAEIGFDDWERYDSRASAGLEVYKTEIARLATEPTRSHFRIPITCWRCLSEEKGGNADVSRSHEDRILVDVTNDGAYSAICKRGHEMNVVLQNPRFELMFESACMALGEGYFHQAVASFAASLDGFQTFLVGVACRHVGVSTDLTEFVKDEARRSERQPAAVALGYAALIGARYPFMSHKRREFRGQVVHEGYFPTFEETLDFAGAVYDQIVRVNDELRAKATDAYQAETVARTLPAHKKFTPTATAKGDAVGPTSPMGMYMTTVLALLDSRPRREVFRDLFNAFAIHIHSDRRRAVP
jgi:hypothetical protein